MPMPAATRPCMCRTSCATSSSFWSGITASISRAFVDAWSDWVDHAARTWLESGHLKSIVIEFYRPGYDTADARWDFPIRYDGNGVDEMWVDRLFFEESFAKAEAPPAGCLYRIVLIHKPGEPYVPGLSSTTMRSINGLSSREIGTVVATPDIMASARYYRR